MDLGLNGKAGIVTGASRGIGAAIVRELAGEGCRVVATARNLDLLQRHEQTASAGEIIAHQADLTHPGSGEPLVEAAISAFGRIDFVVCNAGAAKMGDFASLTDQDWTEGFALKFFGHVRLLRAAWSHLVQSKGAVVIIAGRAGRTPGPAGLVTGTVNSALLNLTKGLAEQGIADGVRVNAINPGAVRTDRFAARVKRTASELGVSEEQAQAHLAAHGEAMRVGEPDDIAGLVAFVLSRRGANLQGAIIDSDGGRTKTL
ncbi:MAG: SDR family oxidoreductase [Rhodospirillales bacterium]|jgi:NAD(P)-dependent dehydrogenase (short-subunit alcohol dehydrogenase family)